MRPGQLHPNELEVAILQRLGEDDPSIRDYLPSLRVLSREYTGVGSFTKFARADSTGRDRQLPFEPLIRMPNVPSGLGAVLFCKGSCPECLEIFTFGDEHWDGVYDGFTIDPTA